MFSYQKFKVRDKVIVKAKNDNDQDEILILKKYHEGRGTSKELWEVTGFYCGKTFITELSCRPALRLI